MKNILFVADEMTVLQEISRTFVNLGFTVWFAESAEAALVIMKKEKIDLIVSDLRMPGMDGIELFNILRSDYPDTIRIILASSSDKKEITYVLQQNLAKAYVIKPWNHEDFVGVVKKNIDQRETNLPPEIISYINNIDKIPTLGTRYKSIMNAIKEEKDLVRIASEVERDQVASAKLLHLVNSAYLGFKTGSIKNALIYIGTEYIEDLLHSLEIMECLSFTGTGSEIAEKIWNHAFYTSKLTKIIKEKFLGKNDNSLNSTAGLLHKIGIVFMLKYYKNDYYCTIKEAMENKEANLRQLETDRFGFSHTELSAYLLDNWKLPEPIVEAAAYYDMPFKKSIVNNELIGIVHIAQNYACAYLDQNPFCQFIPFTFVKLGLEETDFIEKYRSFLEKS
jgi:HD-like signal output (HDOD) protein